MIFVGGVPLSTDSSSSYQGSEDVLICLLAHPVLVSASRSFSDTPERKFSVLEGDEANLESSKPCNHVYVFQREYATADPKHVQFVGTDEATTCVGIAIRNSKNGMTSVAHIDSGGVVDIGLSQMLSSVVSPDDVDAVLDVHVVGAFEDAIAPQHADTNSGGHRRPLEGFSVPLCTKLVVTLGMRKEIFHLQTFHVLKHNTRHDSQGNSYPIFHGFLVEISSGSISPASFDRSSRCPDELVRRIRVIASYDDPSWNGRLLDTYETHTDRFVIAPTTWAQDTLDHASTTVQLSDQEILLTCSSSPLAEGPAFVENQRRLCEYLVKRPDWSETFPLKKPRTFERSADGQWTMI